MTEERLEDTIYNCLDFCLLNGRTPHFYLGGPDPIRHPALWTVLELLREENVSFSLLSEPEKTEYEQNRYPVSEENRIEIACDGMTCQDPLGQPPVRGAGRRHRPPASPCGKKKRK